MVLQDIELNLAVLDLEEYAHRAETAKARFDHTAPVIHESLVDFLLNNSPKLRN